MARIQNDQVAMWYHVIHQADTAYYPNLLEKNPNAKLTGLAPPKVDGYNGFIPQIQIANYDWLIPRVKAANAANVLKYLNWSETDEGRRFIAYGLEGQTWRMENGQFKYLPENDNAQLFFTRYQCLKGLQANFGPEFFTPHIIGVKPLGLGPQLVETQNINYQASKKVAGDGLPATIYAGYTDHLNDNLFREYYSTIIIGEWPISRFDEFVNLWYSTGGTVIEQRANDWYVQYQDIQKRMAN
jgi:putative aldouronate transport system substrate-binding protein